MVAILVRAELWVIKFEDALALPRRFRTRVSILGVCTYVDGYIEFHLQKCSPSSQSIEYGLLQSGIEMANHLLRQNCRDFTTANCQQCTMVILLLPSPRSRKFSLRLWGPFRFPLRDPLNPSSTRPQW